LRTTRFSRWIIAWISAWVSISLGAILTKNPPI
jgi:hypothetical protein